MRITTTDQARQALAAMLDGSELPHDLVLALARADASMLIEAAVALLVAESEVVLGAKGWTLADARRAASQARELPKWARAAIDAALAEPRHVADELRSGRRESFAFVLAVLRTIDYLRRLPRLAPAHPPRSSGDEQGRLHGKVRALLAKAESTPFEAEAEACTAKAQELMARYAMDAAALAAGTASDAPTSMRVIVKAPYARPKVVLLSVVARSNRCRSVWQGDYGFATVFGGPGDLWAVDLLYTSLLVQAGVGLQRETERSRSFRHAFLLAFAHRIGERLHAATARACAAATVASGDAFLPVLASREEATVALRDAAFPQLSRLRVSMSNDSGATAGRQAADAATLARDAAVVGRTRQLAR